MNERSHFSVAQNSWSVFFGFTLRSKAFSLNQTCNKLTIHISVVHLCWHNHRSHNTHVQKSPMRNFIVSVVALFVQMIDLTVAAFLTNKECPQRQYLHRFTARPYPCISTSCLWSATGTTLSQSRPRHVFSVLSDPPPVLHLAFISTSILLLCGYHIVLILRERQIEGGRQPQQTWRQYQADTRENWARHVRDTQGWLYAIQTLRNAITAQTFLATTVLSLLTLITGRMWDMLRILREKAYTSASMSLLHEQRALTVQLMCVACTMLLSAYHFLQGVRLMTHAGFMFPVNRNSTRVDKIMRQTQNCQWLGLRWMYCSLGPITWTVGGSRAFLGISIILVLFFRAMDKKPEGMGYEFFESAGI